MKRLACFLANKKPSPWDHPGSALSQLKRVSFSQPGDCIPHILLQPRLHLLADPSAMESTLPRWISCRWKSAARFMVHLGWPRSQQVCRWTMELPPAERLDQAERLCCWSQVTLTKLLVTLLGKVLGDSCPLAFINRGVSGSRAHLDPNRKSLRKNDHLQLPVGWPQTGSVCSKFPSSSEFFHHN